MFSHYDLIPTFCAAGGEPDVVAKCLKGHQANGKTFKVHLDGYNLMPFFKGEVKESPRKEFIYWNDDGDLVAIRFDGLEGGLHWSRRTQGIGVWQGEFTKLRVPKLFNLRADPFERGDESSSTTKWMFDRAFVQVVPMQAFAAQWLAELQGVPDPAEARELQPRRGDGEAGAEELNALLQKDPAASSAAGSCRSGSRKRFSVSFHASGRGSRPVKGRGGRTRWPRRARRPRRAGTCRPITATYRPIGRETANTPNRSMLRAFSAPPSPPHVRWGTDAVPPLRHARRSRGRPGSRFGRPEPV